MVLAYWKTNYRALRFTPIPQMESSKLQITMYKLQMLSFFDIYGRTVGANLRVRPDNCESVRPQTTIDISHLPSGVYFVKIHTEAGEVVRKVVKESWRSPCRVCNIVLPTHRANAHTPYCKPHSAKTATPLSRFGLIHAPL